jgi:hypothetical protein
MKKNKRLKPDLSYSLPETNPEFNPDIIPEDIEIIEDVTDIIYDENDELFINEDLEPDESND